MEQYGGRLTTLAVFYRVWKPGMETKRFCRIGRLVCIIQRTPYFSLYERCTMKVKKGFKLVALI